MDGVPVMHPTRFGDCFGWLHMLAVGLGGDTAVVLCSGLGRDASTGHRPFRMLADRLAAFGYPTLRFDYPDTGDSCEARSCEYWSVWRQSIQAAADHVRARSGARRVVLIGLRLGATLAAVAASVRDDVAGLVLLEPVLRGRAYVGQLRVEARLRTRNPPNPEARLELDEMPLTDETLQRIGQADLGQMAFKPGCAVSVFSRSHTALLSTCVKAWREAGTMVTFESFAGLEALLRPSHLADEPNADFSPVLTWLRAIAAPTGRQCPRPVSPTVVLRPEGCIETPLRFGPAGRLFGMLCCPEEEGSGKLVVVIGNTGGDPHHGFGRFAVHLARRLAREGISSLRLDFAGLGDSVSLSDDGSGEGVTHVLEVDRAPDIRAAIDALLALGYETFALSGVCSGAYHALHAALVDARVSILLLINLPWFTLRFEKASPASFAQRGMAELSRRRVGSLLLYAAGDSGVKALEQNFGPGGIDLLDTPDTVVSIVPGLDHDLTGMSMRRDVAERLVGFLRQLALVRESPSEAGNFTEVGRATGSGPAQTLNS